MFRKMLILLLALPVAAAAAEPAVSFETAGNKVKVKISSGGATWLSQAYDGVPHPHKGPQGSRPYSVVDVDGDGRAEIVVTLNDNAPGGLVVVFRQRDREFAPMLSEVGPGLQPRDFMVWDIPAKQTAPVTVLGSGEIQILSNEYAVLGVGSGSSGLATYRYRCDGGLIRMIEKRPEPIASAR